VKVIVRKSRFAKSGVAGEAWLRFDAKRGRYAEVMQEDRRNDDAA
jgi:hypothetical protein